MRMILKGLISVFCVLLIVPAAGKVDYNVILKRNIFTEPYIEKKDIKKTNILKPPPPPPLSSLIKIKGVILIGEGGYGIINLKNKNSEVIVRKGEKVLGAKVVEIGEDYITFLYRGKKEKLQIEKEKTKGAFVKAVPGVNVKIGKNSNNKNDGKKPLPEFREPVVVDFEKTISELKNDKNLMKNLNISPYIKNGKVDGFKISKLPQNSIPFKYGLRDGDIIRRVNGILIDSITKGYAVYNQIVQSGTKIVTVEVIRDGNPVVFSYKLK